MTKKNVHVYTRISKAAQQEGSGLDEQLSRIEKYIRDNQQLFNLENITYWQDVGLSAYKNKNIKDGQLGVFLEKIASGEIGVGDVLIIYSLDRLSRRSSWDETSIQMIVHSGVIIHDISTPVVLNRSDPMSKIIMELIISRGNNESKIKSERSISGWQKRLTDTLATGAVFTKKLPRWLGADPAGGYVVLPDQIDIIKRIFTEYVNGLSSPMIAKRLNEEGIKSTGRSLWRPNTITKLIKDERLQGMLRRSDETNIPNVFPVVIDAEIFRQANNILSSNNLGIKGRPRENNNTREVVNVITGLVRCGTCGSKVSTSTNGRGVRYIKCRNRLNFLMCGQKSIRLENLEQIAINHSKQVDMNKVFDYKKNDKSLEATLSSELSSLESEEQECLSQIHERKKEKKRVSLVLATTLTEIQDRIQDVKVELLNLNSNDVAPDISSIDTTALMDASNVDLRMSFRKYLVMAINTISYRTLGDNIIIEFNYKNNVYRHIIITDKKVENILHEVSITSNADSITYSTKEFSLIEDLVNETCSITGLDSVNHIDYFLLANYIGSIDKQWLVDYMYHPEFMNIVMSNVQTTEPLI
ncbi:recombinase family protein [Yersinia enterocolitica]